MEYINFESIFNKKIFEESKIILLEKISKNPNRFVGLFRPTKPKLKIIQNLTQSNEIKFGDAFEILIREYLKQNGYKNLNRDFVYKEKKLDIDQHFFKEEKTFFVEQKIRDDHDSTKKVGQMDNFENKLNALLDINNEKDLVGIVYFIDPDSYKNKKYYYDRIEKLKIDYGVELHLFYGREFFEFLKIDWDEVINFLEKWKGNVPDFPEINFDKNYNETFEEIKDLNPSIYNKLFKDEDIFNEIILTLFPEKKVLKMLLNYFDTRSKETRYKKLYELLENKLF